MLFFNDRFCVELESIDEMIDDRSSYVNLQLQCLQYVHAISIGLNKQ